MSLQDTMADLVDHSNEIQDALARNYAIPDDLDEEVRAATPPTRSRFRNTRPAPTHTRAPTSRRLVAEEAVLARAASERERGRHKGTAPSSQTMFVTHEPHTAHAHMLLAVTALLRVSPQLPGGACLPIMHLHPALVTEESGGWVQDLMGELDALEADLALEAEQNEGVPSYLQEDLPDVPVADPNAPLPVPNPAYPMDAYGNPVPAPQQQPQ
jgi:hypothetical protein